MRFYLAMLWLLLLVGFKCAQKERSEKQKTIMTKDSLPYDSVSYDGYGDPTYYAKNHVFNDTIPPSKDLVTAIATTSEGHSVGIQSYRLDGLEVLDISDPNQVYITLQQGNGEIKMSVQEFIETYLTNKKSKQAALDTSRTYDLGTPSSVTLEKSIYRY